MPASSIVQRGLAVGMLLASPAFAQQHEHGAPTTEKLGTVSFSTSCSPAAQPLFNRAVALLHSFEFAHAIEGFNTTLKTDPSCAMAAWGVALSRWSNPFAPGIRPVGRWAPPDRATSQPRDRRSTRC